MASTSATIRDPGMSGGYTERDWPPFTTEGGFSQFGSSRAQDSGGLPPLPDDDDDFRDPEDLKRPDEIAGRTYRDEARIEPKDIPAAGPGKPAGRAPLSAALGEIALSMRQWGAKGAVAALFSVYMELSTLFHDLYLWFPVIGLAVAAACLALLLWSDWGRWLWRSVGATAVLVCLIWGACFVGRGFSAENPSVLTGMPMMEELRAGIAKLEGIEARQIAAVRASMEEGLAVTDAFLAERRRTDIPVPGEEYERMLRRTEARDVHPVLAGLRCALRVNEARIYLRWAGEDDPPGAASGPAKLQTAEALLARTEEELGGIAPEGRAPRLRGRLLAARGAVLCEGLASGLWPDRMDEAVSSAERGFELLKDIAPDEAAQAAGTLSRLHLIRAAASIDPDPGLLRLSAEAARRGMPLAGQGPSAPELLYAAGLALDAAGRHREAAEAYQSGVNQVDTQLRPGLYALLLASLAGSRAQGGSLRSAEAALEAAEGTAARHAHLGRRAEVQLALARAGTAVGSASRSRKLLSHALEAANRALSARPVMPYADGHIRALCLQALAALEISSLDGRDPGLVRMSRGEGLALEGRIRDMVLEAARQAADDSASLARAADTRRLQEIRGRLEAILYLDRSDPTFSRRHAAPLFDACCMLARVHAALSRSAGTGRGDSLSTAREALARAEELSGGQGRDRLEAARASLGNR